MYIDKEKYYEIVEEVKQANAVLVAVSKTKPAEAIMELYALGHRDFGENYVQELVDKYEALPKDIRWHFIGHLQSNKIKYLAPFIHLIHGIDSLKLVTEVDKQALKNKRHIDVLLQVHIAQEETKFGLDEATLDEILSTDSNTIKALENTTVKGFMGMASFSDDENVVRNEFKKLKELYTKYNQQVNNKLQVLSMGMSGDYKIALQEGSTMVRIGSLLFGTR